jgi:hypothetical protein
VTDVELPLRSHTASSRTSVTEVAYVMCRGPKRAMTANSKVWGGGVESARPSLNDRADEKPQITTDATNDRSKKKKFEVYYLASE